MLRKSQLCICHPFAETRLLSATKIKFLLQCFAWNFIAAVSLIYCHLNDYVGNM